ncbi:Inner centromere protein [Taenia solium]|eukprot:TsM_001229700 transcript=TsM_001229700 gene=TsM_001229700
MDVEASSAQLLRKLGTLSSDLDTLASKTISKLCQRIQIHVPNFIVPDTLGLIDSEFMLSGLKRRTRATRSTAKSSTRSTRSKRRKLTTSTSSIDVSGWTQSFPLSDAEMQTVPEGRSLASITPKLDSVHPVRSKASQSIPEVKPVQGDATEDDTLLAECTTEATQSFRHTQNSLKDSDAVRLKLEPPDPPSSKGRRSSVRTSSKANKRSLQSLERGRVTSSAGRGERLSNVVTKEKSKGSSSKKAKTSAIFVQPLAALESRTVADGSTPVFANVDATHEDASEGLRGNSSIMTEESDDAVDVTEAQTPKSPARPPKIPPSTVAAAADVTTSAAVSTHAVSVNLASQASSTPATSGYAESRLRRNRNTPRPPGLSKPWLSRLGWGTTAKTPSIIANATNIATVTNMTNSNLSHQPQVSRLSAKASVGMGKLKSAIITNASSVVKNAKPTQVVVNFAPRLPMTSQLKKASGTSKANFQAGALPRRTATGLLQSQSAMKVLPKNVAEDNRRARVMAKIAESEQRHQELMEKRAVEHKAKMKAANEHRMAVRANAEREAKEKQAATTRRVEAERLKLQKIVMKAKVPPPKTAISANHQRSSQLINHLPLSSAPTNTAVPAPTTAAASSANYMKNFDLAKVAPPPAAANKSQPPPLPPPPQPSAPRTSPVSYDMSGLLSDYDSDSDNEKRYRKRVIPSWAKFGSSDLVHWVSRMYRGDVAWQKVFRPAENVHFEDSELFHGYKFRTRPRGSSAAWNSPTPPPTSPPTSLPTSPPTSSRPKTPS